jgi:hypothetical protein
MKAILIIILLFWSFRLLAPGIMEFTIPKIEPLRPYEKLWQSICKIESNNDSLAFCIDINGKPSIGIAQIQESRLNDYNKRTGNNYQLMDCFSPVISKKIFMYYCQGDYETTARKWNGGNNGMKIESTIKYFDRIKLAL